MKVLFDELQFIPIFVYDESGAPIGMTYRGADYAANVWDVYWYEKNLQGDIVAVYDVAGTKLVSYIYDAWGNFTTTYHNGGASTSVVRNPYTYRGYYYDNDLGLYRTGTRYYDAIVCRFISPDTTDVTLISLEALVDKNLYSYCDNNPVMRTDHGGEWWNVFWGAVVGAVTSTVSKVVELVCENKLSIDSLDDIAMAAYTGAAVGAMSAISKEAGMIVSASANAIETIIEGVEEGHSVEDIIVETAFSVAMSVVATAGGSDFTLGGTIVKPVPKQTLKKTLKKGARYITTSYAWGQLEDFVYEGLEDFGAWFTNTVIDRAMGKG